MKHWLKYIPIIILSALLSHGVPYIWSAIGDPILSSVASLTTNGIVTGSAATTIQTVDLLAGDTWIGVGPALERMEFDAANDDIIIQDANLYVIDGTDSYIYTGTIDNGTAKQGGFISNQYNAVTEPEGYTTLFAYSYGADNNAVYFGGGVSTKNAATELYFHTAANGTTRTGSQSMKIIPAGVTINNDLTIGEEAIGVDYSITFDGETSDQVLTGDEDNDNFDTADDFLIKADLVSYTYNFGADAEASDTYVITLDPAPAAYTTGMMIVFSANTANTGACTINVNSLGAKALKVKGGGDDPENNWIVAGGIVIAVYDGTDFQIINADMEP